MPHGAGRSMAPWRHPSAWLIVTTAALLSGQAAANLAVLPAPLAFAIALPLLFCIPRTTRRPTFLLAIAALAFLVGYVRCRQLLEPEFRADHLRSIMTQNAKLYLEGVIRQEPEKLPGRTRWLIRAERVWHPTGAQAVTGNVLVNVRVARRDLRYADRVRFWIEPSLPRSSGNPGGFDYAKFLAAREIYAVGYLDNDSEVELIARRPPPVAGAIEDLRRQIRRYIDAHVGIDYAPLVKALTVGDMGEISKQQRSDFTAAGVNHVISISGLHVGMLGLVVFWLIRYSCGFSSYLLLRFNLLKIATFCSFLAVVFYTALAGAMVPTVRSAIMIGVYELAVLLDREEEVLTSLTFAALLIAIVWPGVVSDISFQLSFLAVLFIAWGMMRVSNWFSVKRVQELPQERSWWRDKLRVAGFHLAVPLLATIGTGPLIAHYFGHLSLAGFVSNPVVVPLVGFLVVPIGLLIGFLSLIFPAAAVPVVWVEQKLVGVTVWLVAQFAQLPLANIGVPSPDRLEIALLYGLFFSILLIRRYRPAPLVAAALLVGIAADGAYWWRERWHRTELRITHLNVGQGDAAVVELPGSKVLLIDAGGTSAGDFDTGEAIVAPFLRGRKILKVDYLFVSHARVDHYGGMQSIVREFAPSEFWSGAARAAAARYDELEQALREQGISRVVLHDSGTCRVIDGVRLCALYPPSGVRKDASVVLRLEYGKSSFLFAGEIEKRDERLLQQRAADLHSVVLKVPRHGGAAGNSEEFIATVQPKIAVMSGGRRTASAARQEVAARYRTRGTEVLSTEDDGAITLESDGSSIRYRSHKSGRSGAFTL